MQCSKFVWKNIQEHARIRNLSDTILKMGNPKKTYIVFKLFIILEAVTVP